MTIDMSLREANINTGKNECSQRKSVNFKGGLSVLRVTAGGRGRMPAQLGTRPQEMKKKKKTGTEK